MEPAPITLEACVASLTDARIATQHGATRVELNSALELGGLTPSIGVVEAVVETLQANGIGVTAMARPRPGGFAYSQDEQAVIQRDIKQLIEAGVDGVAFGVLDPAGRVDAQACHALIEPVLASGGQAVFHRAFDLTPDKAEALETLIGLGFHRVLTSGGSATAIQGADTIRELIEQSAGRIEVLPGGGIRADNVAQLIAATGCTQVHASMRSLVDHPVGAATPGIEFNSTPPEGQAYHATDAERVAALTRALAKR